MRKGKEKNRCIINTGSEAELFLEDVKAQIQYKPAAERAGKELYAHMEDKAEDYRREGMPEEAAMDQAVKDMGDASALGVMLNQTHQVRVPSMFVLAVILAVLAGLAGNFLEYCSRKYCSQPGQWGEQLILAAGMSLYFPCRSYHLLDYFQKGLSMDYTVQRLISYGSRGRPGVGGTDVRASCLWRGFIPVFWDQHRLYALYAGYCTFRSGASGTGL